MLRDSFYLTAFGSTALWLAITAVLAAGLVAAVIRSRYRFPTDRLRPAARETTVFALLAAYAGSALAVIELSNASRFTSAPFVRNSMFVGYAVLLWCCGAAERQP